MGRCPNHKNSKKKGYCHKTALRARFMKKGDDLIHTEMRLDEPKPLPLDADLPGMGQNYCLLTAILLLQTYEKIHNRTKLHKKWVKLLKEAHHSQLDAADRGRPDNGPKVTESRSAIPVAMESF